MEKETSEIVKLTERISKDPRSKLFVPLAEEYKKAGDLEMAIHVLSEGLKNNPTYITARSVLGKLLLEKGDLEASQKEFEEVVKTIPDNLMAQRKLADLYVLQNRSDEALKHYKIVLSLNPQNEEISSLISDLESGRDVTTKLNLPKPLSSLRKPAKQEPPADRIAQVRPQEMPTHAAEAVTIPVQAEAAMTQTSGSASEDANVLEVEPASIPQTTVPAAVIEAGATSAPSAPTVEEEPEDVLAIEPLDMVSSEPGSEAPVFDLLTEKEQDIKAAPTEEKASDILFPEHDQHQSSLENIDQIPTEPKIVNEERPEEPPPFPSGMPMETDLMAAEFVAENPQNSLNSETLGFPETVPTEAPEDISGKSDDFTTDTLAELYIGQGFYEKAIDIYQRMLADKPNSQGLKDKLERVRAMAVDAVSGQTALTEEIQKSKSMEGNIFSGAGMFEPSIAAEERLIDAEVFPEPKEFERGSETGTIEEKTEAKQFTELREMEPLAEERARPVDADIPAEWNSPSGKEAGEEKAERVAPSEPLVEDEEVVIEAEVLAEPEEYQPGRETGEKKKNEGLFDRPREQRPVVEKEEHPTTRKENGASMIVAPPDRDFPRPEPLTKEFEPKEYVPLKPEPKPGESKPEQLYTVPKPSKAIKKDTIDRLETWLRNIKKEK